MESMFVSVYPSLVSDVLHGFLLMFVGCFGLRHLHYLLILYMWDYNMQDGFERNLTTPLQSSKLHF